MSSFGLLFLISTLLFLLYRTGNRARDQRELQNQLQTISDLLDSNNIHGNHNPPDLPPMYDLVNSELPSYDEVIKVGMEDQMKGNIRKTDKKFRHHRRRYFADKNNVVFIYLFNNQNEILFLQEDHLPFLMKLIHYK